MSVHDTRMTWGNGILWEVNSHCLEAVNKQNLTEEILKYNWAACHLASRELLQLVIQVGRPL